MSANDGGRSPMQRLQFLRKIAVAVVGIALGFLFLLTGSRWRDEAPRIYELIEIGGTVLIFIGIIGRTWCTLYIGGRKRAELVTTGPYSLARNPLYSFTLVAVAGIGAQTGSLSMAGICVAAVLIVFAPLVRREEALLASTFGADFAAYIARTPRFLPRFSGWRDVESLVISPRLMRETFFDASLFLVAIPLADIVDMLQESGVLPVLLRLF